MFRLLMNHTPISRICEVADLSYTPVYGKIDFLHRQCLTFAAERERQFPEFHFERLYLCSDRQDYIVNWGDRNARKTVQLTSVGTADHDGIRDRRVDAFFVAIAKDRTVDEKRAATAEAKMRLDEALTARGLDPALATSTEVRHVKRSR
ncbi:MAG: hypothetical protein ACLGJC_23090 [Alphaproteobacteria bacterium]